MKYVNNDKRTKVVVEFKTFLSYQYVMGRNKKCFFIDNGDEIKMNREKQIRNTRIKNI